MKESVSGSVARVHSHKVCVLYEHPSGRIRHIHRFVTLEGGHEPAPHEMEAAAVRQAKKLNRHSGALKVLFVDPSSIQPLRFYAVDVKDTKLVERSAV